MAASAFVALLFAGPVLAVRAGWLVADEGIVLRDALEALSGPSAAETVLVTVPLGTKVRIDAAGGSWLDVSVADGWHGWVPADAIGRIAPPE